MSTTQIAILAFAALGLLGALAVASVALRRGGESGPVTGRTDRKALRRDRKRRRTERTAAPVEPELHDDEPAPIDPAAQREEVDEEQYGVTRRQFFNRGVAGIFGLFMAQMGIFTLGFLWPRLKAGGFGSKVSAGRAADLAEQVFLPDGRVIPLFVPAAQAYLVPFQGVQAGSSFEGLPVIAGGLMALWQRCVHLGCRVPQCDASQGFECPCHGSKYNFHGEYEDGPAPRNLDRFVVEVDDSGQFIIDTGQVVQTSRASHKTATYPQGPSCI